LKIKKVLKRMNRIHTTARSCPVFFVDGQIQKHGFHLLVIDIAHD